MLSVIADCAILTDENSSIGGSAESMGTGVFLYIAYFLIVNIKEGSVSQISVITLEIGKPGFIVG